MTNLFQKYKSILIIAGIFFLVGLVYIVFIKKEAEPDLQKTSNTNETVVENRDLLIQLKTLGSLRLDTSVFESSTFNALESNTITLEDRQPEGRVNPFSPLGDDGSLKQISNPLNSTSTTNTNNQQIGTSTKVVR